MATAVLTEVRAEFSWMRLSVLFCVQRALVPFNQILSGIMFLAICARKWFFMCMDALVSRAMLTTLEEPGAMPTLVCPLGPSGPPYLGGALGRSIRVSA